MESFRCVFKKDNTIRKGYVINTFSNDNDYAHIRCDDSRLYVTKLDDIRYTLSTDELNYYSKKENWDSYSRYYTSI